MVDTAYIQTIATNTSTDISKWNLQKIFGAAKDRRDINKRFFAQINKIKVPVEEKQVISSTISKALARNLGANKLKIATEIELKAKLKTSQELSIQQSKLQTEIVALRKKLNERKGSSVSVLIQQVQEIVKDGFWENPIFTEDNKHLWFNTKNDVVAHDIRHKTDKDSCANFGKFSLRVELDNFAIGVGAYKDNKETDGCLHPFLSLDDRDQVGVIHPCYGNAFRLYDSLRSNMELAKLMKLTAALLVSYESDGGYTDIEYFTNGRGSQHGTQDDIIGAIQMDNQHSKKDLDCIQVGYHPHVWKEHIPKVIKRLNEDDYFYKDNEANELEIK